MAAATKNTPAPPTNSAPSRFKEGDRVLIAAREQTPADTKSALYYPHYANLRGKVLKVYGEEASVLVDRESLPGNVRARHEESEAAERQKYLDRMSEDAKSRMGQREKEFTLNYAVLVSVADLRPDTGAPAAAPVPATEAEKAEAKAVGAAMRSVDPVTGESIVGEASQTAAGAGESGTDSNVKRLSESDLAAAEEAHLAQRRKGGRGA